MSLAFGIDWATSRGDGRRVVQGWQHCWQESTLEKIVEYGLLAGIDDRSIDVFGKTRE